MGFGWLGFDIPKTHNQHHFSEVIEWLGTTDNYNTETSERYHIDVAKKAWAATNHKNVVPQMLTWLDRQEKLFQQAAYLWWIDQAYDDDPDDLEPWGWCGCDDNRPQLVIPHDENEEEEIHMEQYKLAQKPQYPHMTIVDAEKLFGLSDLKAQIIQFLYKRTQLQSAYQSMTLPKEWELLDIWTSVKIREPQVVSADDGQPGMRNILARLQTKNSSVPCFHTVLVDPAPESGQDRDVGLTGMYSYIILIIQQY